MFKWKTCSSKGLKPSVLNKTKKPINALPMRDTRKFPFLRKVIDLPVLQVTTVIGEMLDVLIICAFHVRCCLNNRAAFCLCHISSNSLVDRTIVPCLPSRVDIRSIVGATASASTAPTSHSFRGPSLRLRQTQPGTHEGGSS